MANIVVSILVAIDEKNISILQFRKYAIITIPKDSPNKYILFATDSIYPPFNCRIFSSGA